MSYALDVNVLLYASAAQSPFHQRAVEFLEQRREVPELMCLAWSTLIAYLRLATNPVVLSPPLDPAKALENIDALVAMPHVRILAEEEGFLRTYREATHGLVVRGNLVSDAHLVALLRQHGVRTLYTNDRDFRRFRPLRVINPFDA